MNGTTFRIAKNTRAIIDVTATARFYRSVFPMQPRSFDVMRATLHTATSLGFNILRCTNTLVGVTAGQSHHQLDVMSPGIGDVIARHGIGRSHREWRRHGPSTHGPHPVRATAPLTFRRKKMAGSEKISGPQCSGHGRLRILGERDEK
jgi:hypothetical protein